MQKHILSCAFVIVTQWFSIFNNFNEYSYKFLFFLARPFLNCFGLHLVLIVMGRDQSSFELHFVFNMDVFVIELNFIFHLFHH